MKYNDSVKNAIQENGDADLLIATTALQQSIFENTVIVGEDIDLLCHLIAQFNKHHKILFTSKTKANSKERARTFDNMLCPTWVFHS